MAEDGICVLTHPLGAAGENATRSLLEILAEISSVCLVTANLPGDSVIRDRHEVVEISPRTAGQTVVPIAAVRFVLNQLRMVRAITRRDESIVVFFGATSYLLPILTAKLLGRRVVLEPRGDVPLTLRLTWERRLPDPVARVLAGPVALLESVGYRLADAIVTYTPSMAGEMGLDRYGDKLYPNGARYVDTGRFRVDVPFERRENVVGYLGRLDEEKGIRALADAVERLPDDTVFRFVGDGDLRPWLETRLGDAIADGRVELVGWVDHDDVPAELNRLRLLVLPSRPTEGLPTTILESLACGTPVLATPVSGTPDVVRDGDTGFLSADVRPPMLAADIERILERDDLAEISRRGRRLIESDYTFEAAVERYSRILADLAVQSATRGRSGSG